MNNYPFKLFLLFYIFISFNFIGCNTRNDSQNIVVGTNYKLSLIDSLNLPLDSATMLQHPSMKAISLNGFPYLIFFNEINNKGYYYNLSSGKLDKEIQYEVEGPNGIGMPNNFTLYYPFTFDSTLIINPWSRKLFIFKNALKVFVDSLSDLEEKYSFNPNASPISTIILKDRDIYIPGYPGGKTRYQTDLNKFSPVLRFNLDSKKHKLIGNLNTAWNKGMYTQSPTILTPMVYADSFNVFICDAISNKAQKLSQSAKGGSWESLNFKINSNDSEPYEFKFKDQLTPWISEPKEWENFKKWDNSRSRNGPIYYISDLDMFARIVFEERSEDVIMRKLGRPKTIFILNMEGTILGYTKFDNLIYDYSSIHFVDGKFYFQLHDKFQDNEDSLKFHIYEIISDET